MANDRKRKSEQGIGDFGNWLGDKLLPGNSQETPKYGLGHDGRGKKVHAVDRAGSWALCRIGGMRARLDGRLSRQDLNCKRCEQTIAKIEKRDGKAVL